ncbi:MAG TPA: SMP-30/gluconolactonase/LRE family protein [Amycolatopsis sp.]|nr:SMP-30/gluconolactonase/LRE family protein [Amycolatopsis sp.]
MRAQVVVDGIAFGEGPVWCPDGTVVCTDVAAGVLYRVWPEQHRKAPIAVTGGGPNGAVLAGDGGFVVAQNGGLDFAALGMDLGVEYRPVRQGLQRVWPDGRVTYLADNGFRAPNDLVVADDGLLYFTDPPNVFELRRPRRPGEPEPLLGRVWTWSADQGPTLHADGFSYCNGIGFDGDGHLVIVERQGLLRVFPDGSREWVVEDLGWSDGFCTDVDGRFYAASPRPGVVVVDSQGTVVDFLELPGDGKVSNCCFGGPENRWLFAADTISHTLVVWTDLPVRGVVPRPCPVGPEAG